MESSVVARDACTVVRAGASRGGSEVAAAADGMSVIGCPTSCDLHDSVAVTSRLLVVDTPACADGFIEAVVVRFLPGAQKLPVQLVVLVVAMDGAVASPTSTTVTCVVRRRIGVTLPLARGAGTDGLVPHTLVLPSRLPIRRGEHVGIACVAGPLLIASGSASFRGTGSSRSKFFFAARVPGMVAPEATRLQLTRDPLARVYGFGATFASASETARDATAASTAVRTPAGVTATGARSATVDQASEAAALMRRLAGDSLSLDAKERLPDAKLRAALVRRNTRTLTWAAPAAGAGREAGDSLAAAPPPVVVSCPGAARLVVEIDTSRELPAGLMLSAMPIVGADAKSHGCGSVASGAAAGGGSKGGVATDITGVPLFGSDSICAVSIVESAAIQAVTIESSHPLGPAPMHELRTLSFPGACSVSVMFTAGCATKSGAYVRVCRGGGGNIGSAENATGGIDRVAPMWHGMNGIPPIVVDGDVVDVICHSDGAACAADWGWRFVAIPNYVRPRVYVEACAASFSVVPGVCAVCCVLLVLITVDNAGSSARPAREPLLRKPYVSVAAAAPTSAVAASGRVGGVGGIGLCVGMRVQRGAAWTWGEQDGRGPGTVVKVRRMTVEMSCEWFTCIFVGRRLVAERQMGLCAGK